MAQHKKHAGDTQELNHGVPIPSAESRNLALASAQNE